ncbi:hypothetical protein ACFTWF_38630 [Rhodococcus sp. NPDC056960]|uniref:hypothetical protein n=1 Tax=Rhodococcus sp. NPDC056960 TaxID=3345982 RepID=UPI003630916B
MNTTTTDVIDVALEDDPTPFVLALGHVLRLSRRRPELAEHLREIGEKNICVAVRAGTTHQSASLEFGRTSVTVAHGVREHSRCTLTLDPDRPYTVSGCTPADAEDAVVYAVSAVLNPPIPAWEDAAREFWELTRSDRGMPDRLIVTCSDGRKLVLGEGAAEYELYGEHTVLARVLSGIESFFTAVATGALRVRGTTAQLSVMVGAAWKVQFHG